MEVALNAVSNKGGHGDTAVLDLRMTEPSNGLLLVETPESSVDKVQRIPELNNGVELSSKSFKISL